MKNFFSLIFFLFVSITIYSQDNLLASTISPELKSNANAVLRNETIDIEIVSISKIKKTYSRTITVLNEAGNKYVRAVVGYDNSKSINKLEARIYDGFGEEIKKVRKGDFKDVSAVDGGTLYSDSRVKYMEYTPISYPYTVVFNYTWDSPNTGNVPNWFPLEGYYISTEKSTYSISKAEGLKLKTKEYNFNDYNIVKDTSENKLVYTSNNLLAIKPEAYSPSFRQIAPKVDLLCNPFKYEGIKGNFINWEDLGKWMYSNLLIDRDKLSAQTINKVKELTQNATTDIEKARIIYKYLQDRTRYISVQVGIGGLQPIKANEVDKMGYGDCKGLTNYMKAMLDIAGVTSYYTHVEANDDTKVSFDKDFASLGAGNHVILNIPNNGDDVWLECTSQTTPFGFLGQFTDDRNVLVITPEGGVLKRTKSYKEIDNYMVSNTEVVLAKDGSVEASFNASYGGTQYDSRTYLEREEPKDLEKYYKNSLSYIKDFNLVSTKLTNNKDKIELTEELNISSKVYTSKAGDKLLLNPNVFNRINFVPPRYLNRKLPVVLERGFKDEDTVTIKLPDSYTIETLSRDIILDSKFGEYKALLKKIDEKTIQYNRVFKLLEGNYSKEDYKDFRSFMRKVAKADKTPIVLIKNKI